MNCIRVLHVLGTLDSGGAESRTMDIYRKIDREKVQFDFLIHTEKKCFFEDEIYALGGRIYRMPQRTLKNSFKYYKKLKRFFNQHKEYKIVHGHSLSSGFLYLSIAKKCGASVCIAHSRCGLTNHSDFVSKIKRNFKKLSRFYATEKFAVSKIAGIAAFGCKSIERNEVKIIPNGIDAKKYTYNADVREKMRKELNIDNNVVIGHIGRFQQQKNHDFIIEVFSEIHKKEPNSKLILVGDGELKSKIEEKVNTLQLSDSVIFTGVRSDVPDLLQAMDVLLFPSFFEGLPGVVLEAQAAGLPSVISDKITDEVKITDLVEYLPLNKNAEYWAEKLLEFSRKFERRNTYNEIVEAGYDIESVAKWYEDFYLNSI